MSAKIFNAENLDEYRQNPDIIHALHGVSLLNHDEFMNWYSPPHIRFGERGERLPKTLSSRLPEIEGIHRISKDTMRTLAESACNGKIARDYGETAIDRLTETKFDLLVAVAPDHEELNNPARISTSTKAPANRKIKYVLGFIIVEKGECKDYPEEYCVNLICARAEPQYKKFRGDPYELERVKGSLLMGAYLYCLKKHGKQMGILELADGYNNVSGFISYTKMGFAVDKPLYNYNCFGDCANLPMSVSLADTTYEQIIGRASGASPLSKAELKLLDPTGLSILIPRNSRQNSIQKKVATLCNLLYKTPYIMRERCRLSPKDDKEEKEVYEKTKEEIRKEKEDTTKRQRKLSEGEIDESEKRVIKPTTEEIMEKLEDKKSKLVEAFEEAVVEPVEMDVPVSPKEKSRSHDKTKRKRSPSLNNGTDDVIDKITGKGSKGSLGKGKGTKKRRSIRR